MPVMYLYTNLRDGDIPENFEHQLSEKAAEVLNKPIERITLTVVPGIRQCRGGSSDPMATLTIYSIGVFGKEKNHTYTQSLMDFLSTSLKLPSNRQAATCLQGYRVIHAGARLGERILSFMHQPGQG